MRHLLILALGAVAAACAATTAGAATTPLSASFQTFFGNSKAHPCDAFACSVGSVSGYGSATSQFFVTGFSGFGENGCGDATAVEIITLDSGAGTLTLDETGTVCAPTPAEATTPGSPHSFGNPYRLSFTYTVADGTGVFAGASGTGTISSSTAGESGHATIRGSLTLP